MNLLKKLLLISFCGAFFAVRTKMSHDIQRQIDDKSSKQVNVWDHANASHGTFVKR